MDNNYFNTNQQTGENLVQAEAAAKTQKELILEIFKDRPDPKTPFDVSVILVKMGYKWPITSIRARMTSLTKENSLVKSSTACKKGDYNKDNHLWKLNGFKFGLKYD